MVSRGLNTEAMPAVRLSLLENFKTHNCYLPN